VHGLRPTQSWGRVAGENGAATRCQDDHTFRGRRGGGAPSFAASRLGRLRGPTAPFAQTAQRPAALHGFGTDRRRLPESRSHSRARSRKPEIGATSPIRAGRCEPRTTTGLTCKRRRPCVRAAAERRLRTP